MATTKTKTRRVERKKTATREVTVRLFGWPAEVRRISIVEACWMVELRFKTDNKIMTHIVFECDDYDKALEKYNAFVKIVEDQ